MNNPNNDLLKKIETLEKQNEKLNLKLKKRKSRPSPLIGVGFICLGILMLELYVLYKYTLLMFPALAIILWGSLLLYIRPAKYMRSVLLDSTVLSFMESLDQLIQNSGYTEKAIYLPPKSLKETKSGQVFIPKNNAIIIVPNNEIEEQHTSATNSDGIFLTPPGEELANLFEKELGKKFTEVSLKYLTERLPKVFTENLEIAKKCELSHENDTVTVKLKKVSYHKVCKRLCGKSKICETVGCPFCSAIACALARTTDKPIIIDKNSFDKKTVHIQFKILEE